MSSYLFCLGNILTGRHSSGIEDSILILSIIIRTILKTDPLEKLWNIIVNKYLFLTKRCNANLRLLFLKSDISWSLSEISQIGVWFRSSTCTIWLQPICCSRKLLQMSGPVIYTSFANDQQEQTLKKMSACVYLLTDKNSACNLMKDPQLECQSLVWRQSCLEGIRF